MANATVLRRKLFYVDSGIAAAERADIISQLEECGAIITDNRERARFIILAATINPDGLGRRGDDSKIRDPEWVRRFLAEIPRSHQHTPALHTAENRQTTDHHTARPLPGKKAARRSKQPHPQLKYTDKDLVRVADYVASRPGEQHDLQMFETMVPKKYDRNMNGPSRTNLNHGKLGGNASVVKELKAEKAILKLHKLIRKLPALEYKSGLHAGAVNQGS
ncbi:hypothetical protein FRC17_000968 [Serendipita sp. 399]|nr:hypothetical protein FRC17_000968 [Serendipita sp. 399]